MSRHLPGAIFDTVHHGGLSSVRCSYQFRLVELKGHRSQNKRSFLRTTYRDFPKNGKNRQVVAMIFNVVNADFVAVRFTVQTQLSSATDEQLQTSKSRRRPDNVAHTPAPGRARAA